MSLTLFLLGRFRVSADGEKVPAIPQRKARALFAYLSLANAQTCSRESLCALLWGNRDEVHARASLRQALTALRKWLEPHHPGLLRSDKENVSLGHDVVHTDVEDFQRLCATGTAPELAKAIALYRSNFLDDLDIQEMPFEEWRWQERLRLQTLAVGTLEKMALHQLTDGDALAALTTARQLLSIDPVYESGHRLSMRALACSGQRAAALKQYRVCERLLRQNLAVSPETETHRLYLDIQSGTTPPTIETGPAAQSVRIEATTTARAAIAVLPFNNLSDDPEQEYFADGMTEDIISGLSRFRTLFVASRNSSFAYKGTSPNVREVARTLGVEYVVEGSVRRNGQRLRISAQLINAEAGAHIWTERFDRLLTDIFAVQDEVTEAIVAAIAPEVSRAELARARRRRPDDLDVWSRYQHGLGNFYSSTEAGLMSAIDLFDGVNESDPSFAPAFAMAAGARWRYAEHFQPDDRTGFLELALKKAYTAITLDPRDTVGLCHAGTVHSMLGQYKLAVAKLEEAISLNPADALGHHCLGMVLRRAGRIEQAIPHIDRAIRLSPRDVWIAGMLTDKAFLLFALERYEEAFEWAQRARLSPHPRTLTFAVLGAVLTRLGRLEEARKAVEDLLAHAPGLTCGAYRMSPVSTAQVMEGLTNALREVGLPD